MISKVRAILTILVILVSSLYILPEEASAEIIICYSDGIQISPSIGNSLDTYTVKPVSVVPPCEGDPNNSLLICAISGGNVHPREVFTKAIPGVSSITFDPVSYSGLSPGNYEVYASRYACNDQDWYLGSFTVAEEDEDDLPIAGCGDYVVDASQCPAVCPEIFTNDVGSYCACGGVSGQFACCDVGNTSGSPRCQPQYVCGFDECVELGTIDTCQVDGHEGLDTAIGCVPFDNINIFAANIISRMGALSGGIALLIISLAAFLYMTSGADPKKLELAKELIVAAVTGLLLILLGILAYRVIAVNILALF